MVRRPRVSRSYVVNCNKECELMPGSHFVPATRLLTRAAAAVLLAVSCVFLAPFDAPTNAASSAGCEGGGFSVVLPGGAMIAGGVTTTVPAASLGTSFLVKGKYVEFQVVSSSFGIVNYTFTGAANDLDITGGVRTVVLARKTPDHRGLTLTGPLNVQLTDTDIVIDRSGVGLSMKIQAKDCANGGLFQME